MSKIYTSADQLIGHTPLLELTHIEKDADLSAKLLAKLEYFNPAGSVKDRIAKAMIDDAETRGALKPGSSLAARTTMNDRMADMRVAAPEISGDTVRIRCQFSNADGRGGSPPP